MRRFWSRANPILFLEAGKSSVTKRKDVGLQEETEMDCWEVWSLLKGFLMLWADSQRGNSLEDYRAPAPETDRELGGGLWSPKKRVRAHIAEMGSIS